MLPHDQPLPPEPVSTVEAGEPDGTIAAVPTDGAPVLACQTAGPAPVRPMLSLRGVSVTFGGVAALKNIDLDIHPHEIIALVGENAAGKSTLAKVIAGVYHPSTGSIYSDGLEVTIASPTASARLGIATVFQDLALADNLDVAANMYLGHELNWATVLRQAEMEIAARETLEEIGARIPSIRYPVAELSAGQRQSVAIARALLIKPRIVVLDEPTSRLSITQTAEVLNLIVHLRDKGLGVVLISHNLADIQAIADRVAVLRHGRLIGSAPMALVSYEDIVAAITGAVQTLPVTPTVRSSRLVGAA